MQESRRREEDLEARRLKIEQRRATAKWIAQENQFIMLDANSMDPMACEFWGKTQMSIIRSKDAGGDGAHTDNM